MKNLNIVRPDLPSAKNIQKEFKKILQNGLVTNNQKNVVDFELGLKKYLKSKFTPILFTNGEMALFHLIQAWKYKLNIKKKCYALVPSFTFSGTINALILNNIEPIFCDINENLLIDLNKIQIKKDVKFLIAVSVYGNMPNIDLLKKINKKIICILDSAPAFGSQFKGKFACQFGIDEIYSFHATKILTSMEGGCAISSCPIINEYLKRLRDFGQFEKTIGNIDIPGLNSKMQEISAIVGRYNLKKFNNNLKKRKILIKKFRKFFLKLEEKKYIKNMKVNKNVFCTYLYYPIIILNKTVNEFQLFMKQKGIATRKYYTAVHSLKYYKNKFKCNFFNKCGCKRICKEKGLTNTLFVSSKVVALPIYNSMTKVEMNYLFSNINNFFQNHKK
jgi:dTDP-4-amino-4,6-dideoxygalactose transaminase